jgi:hypothetical protein
LVVWGLNSCLLCKHSSAWASPPARFALVILEIESYFLPMWAWTIILLFYASRHCWNDRCVPPHPTFFSFQKVLQTFFTSWPRTLIILPVSASCMDWDDRCTPPWPAIGWDGGFANSLPGLTLNHSPLYLSLPSQSS